ncbi:MAG TPA: hypothetical protein VFR23_04130 [Jiangellaceae bacterium]|nr:hypothetical protein [Jiangellaceae bacterium]
MSNLALARAIALSVFAGTCVASFVFMVSVTTESPRVWPGTVVGFLMAATSTFLIVTPKRR